MRGRGCSALSEASQSSLSSLPSPGGCHGGQHPREIQLFLDVQKDPGENSVGRSLHPAFYPASYPPPAHSLSRAKWEWL